MKAQCGRRAQPEDEPGRQLTKVKAQNHRLRVV
jgi:hypothetical protein